MLKRFIILVVFSVVFLLNAKAQEIKVIDVAGLEAILNKPTDKLYVINFWATWCKPCVAEMPYFEKARENYADQNIEFLLVSLDFVESLERVKKFVQKKELQSNFYLLDEVDANLWVDKVSSAWQGDIPATLFLNNAQNIRDFHAKEFKQEELDNVISQHLK